MGNKKSKSSKKKSNPRENNKTEEADTSDESSDMDSDVEMGSESDDEKKNEDNEDPKPSTSRQTDDLSDSSSSGDETCEKCAICLRLIKSQEVGSPEGCDHLFCAVCIIEWSKNSNVCPLDRQPFTIILVRKNINGNVVRQVTVEEPRPIEILELEDDTFCEICGGSDREDRILLCDGCDRGFHTECLTPPLLEIPAEEEWFCPDCADTTTPLAEEVHMYASELDDLLEDAEITPRRLRNLRPRNPSGRVISRVRTRLFERIRQAVVFQMVQNNRMRDIYEDVEDEESVDDGFLSFGSSSEESASSFSSDSESVTSESQPGPSGLQTKAKPKTKPKTKKKTTRKRKTTKKGKTTKKKTTKKRKTRKTGTKRKTTKRRKTSTKTSTKKIKIENEDGTITEKIVQTKRTVRRRKPTKKRKTRKTRKTTKVSKRSRFAKKPQTVKGRLALTLGMVPPKKPGQLLPDVKIKPREQPLSGIDLNRARAGIPTLHIFEPRDELQYYSSGSDHEEFGESGSGGVATATRSRHTPSTRIIDRKKAAVILQSSKAPKRKPVVVESTTDSVDILGSILESQTIWHSKDTDVKINFDGSIEYIKDKRIDVRDGGSDEKSTKTPMYPGSGNNSNPGNFGSFNNRNYGGARGGNDNNFGSGGGNVNFNRFGAPRNDREGYANYLNNMPQGPTPFCRGGPPLRFRMPARPQLRRGAFPPRLNRPAWQNDEEENEQENEENNKNEEKNEEEDVDLYSDIETPAEKEESNVDENNGSYPTLGPPPEPPAFLLGIDENGDVPQDKDKSDVYDPAEPCDSEDEMVIDENEKKDEEKEKESEEKEEKEEKDKKDKNIVSNYSSPSRSPEKSPAKRASEDDDEDCPIFSIYSSASREFSQKEEEEREREIAEEKRKIEEMKLKDENQKEENARLSFEFEDKAEKSQSDKSPSLSPERDEIEEENQKSPSRSPEKKEENEEKIETPKIATGLEGLDVEEVSSENGEGDDFADKRSLSSLSLSELSNRSRSKSPVMMKKKKKKKRKTGKNKKNYEEGEIDDSDKRDIDGKNENEEIGNENSPKSAEKRKRRKSADSDRQVLGSKENKKQTKDNKTKDKDLSWKKPSKKDKNYREGKRRSKERRSRSRSRSRSRRRSKSPDNKKDKKKNKDRKKKAEKKKEIERYDVRKIVKNKEVRKTDAFGRDIISKSRSVSRSRSRSPIRDRTRNMLRRDSRSFSRSRSRSFRRGRSPVRRRYLRSRSRSRSKSVRRSFSRSRSRSPRKTKKKIKKTNRSRSRRKSRSISRNRRRSVSRSRSRSPVRVVRNKKIRSRRSYSHHISRSPSFSPRRTRSISRSPIRIRRSYSRSVSSSWSRGRSPLPRAASLEKLTVVLTTKDKKKGKKKKDGKKGEEKRRKKSGNSKEVFASGDNVLVSVNFRNNTNTNSNPVNNDNSRRLESLSPIPKKKKEEKKKKSTVSKNVVDAALSVCPKRAKKLTRLSEKDAEVILNRKPVAVIDLDMSPYREQTPSPINVVVVSDSGSGDEGKEQSPQRQNRQSPGSEIEKSQENIPSQSDNISAPSSPVTNGYLTQSGPKTPPEPQIKFSISKPQQLRQIANPLGDDDDEEEVEDEEDNERLESLDRRIEKELEASSHKGPNTPPEPRGPSTPPSSQTSPDAYDPFEPTKSRSPSPSQDKENRPSPKPDSKDEQPPNNTTDNANVTSTEETDKPETTENEDKNQEQEGDVIPVIDSSTNVIPVQTPAEIPESPERKITVVITTPQNNKQTPNIQKPYAPILKTIPMAPTTTSSNLTTPPVFSLPSPTKTSKANTTTTQSLQVMGIQRLQHRLGSPVNRTPNSIKSTPEKRSTPRNENFSKRNGEQKQPRPLQDATNETIDMTIDMDDSPYSPASSEGDDLFDPPVESAKPPPAASKPIPVYKPTPGKTQQHKSPIKQLSKFDLLFGPSGPQLSPVKPQSKKAKTSGKNLAAPKIPSAKAPKKNSSKRGISLKMDEDQLRILDELPSSAVELQVKDKFLKKLNRQERVVDEVKTVLKPHYARKHITKEEYKDILRRAVPKICHSRSGEINPSKIQSLIEAYVRKFRHAKKKGTNAAAPKPKTKKTMFS